MRRTHRPRNAAMHVFAESRRHSPTKDELVLVTQAADDTGESCRWEGDDLQVRHLRVTEREARNYAESMARREGLEPPTLRFED